MNKLPLNDEILIAVSKMVDDYRSETREPSHSQLETQIGRANLLGADPVKNGQTVGKAKRVRAVLQWAIENDTEAGEYLVYLLVSMVKGLGGFRESSPNYIGNEAISSLVDSFTGTGVTLSYDGTVAAAILENLSGIEGINILMTYALRAKKGVSDAALLTGTSKDLMEAVAKYVIQEVRGCYPDRANFPTLMGQAFFELGLVTTHDQAVPGEHPSKRLERSLYELACSVNAMRNREGTGHGRITELTLSEEESILCIESIGVVSEFLLAKAKSRALS